MENELKEVEGPNLASVHIPAIALHALKAGEPIIFPTDTLYGMGVSVRDAESPEILYQLKRREKRKPVAWLISDIADLSTYGKVVPELDRKSVV